MYQVIPAGEQQRSPGGTVTFEGEPHGSGVSFFLVSNEPGRGRTCTDIPIPKRGSSAAEGRGSLRTAKTSRRARRHRGRRPTNAAQVQEHGPGSARHHLHPRVASADPGGARVRFRSRIGQESPMEA
jgi:hypothetical protein